MIRYIHLENRARIKISHPLQQSRTTGYKQVSVGKVSFFIFINFSWFIVVTDGHIQGLYCILISPKLFHHVCNNGAISFLHSLIWLKIKFSPFESVDFTNFSVGFIFIFLVQPTFILSLYP